MDYEGRRLYWADAQLDRIETSDLNGRNRVVLISNVAHPFGLTVVSRNQIWISYIQGFIKSQAKNYEKKFKLIPGLFY